MKEDEESGRHGTKVTLVVMNQKIGYTFWRKYNRFFGKIMEERVH